MVGNMLRQLFSSGRLQFRHVGNDAQENNGVLSTSLLVAGGVISTFKIPLWGCWLPIPPLQSATMSGGWRIIKTMGQNHQTGPD